MYANTCWGLLGLAVTFGLAVIGLPSAYEWAQPYFWYGSIGCLVSSIGCFAWPLVKRLAVGPAHYSADINAAEGFKTIFARSHWIRKLDWRKLPHGWYETSQPLGKTVDDRLHEAL